MCTATAPGPAAGCSGCKAVAARTLKVWWPPRIGASPAYSRKAWWAIKGFLPTLLDMNSARLPAWGFVAAGCLAMTVGTGFAAPVISSPPSLLSRSTLSSSAAPPLPASAPPTCQVRKGVMIGGPTIQSLPGTSNPTSCCELCSNPNLHPTCVGFSITANGTCLLKSSLNDGQQPESGALSGIVGNHSHFRVHYGNPYPSQAANNGTAACQGDEIVYEIGGGSFCSPACLVNETTGNLGACPSDKPAGMTANALCVLTDPIAGSSGHCALVCKSDADCGPSASCLQTYSKGLCIYPTDKLAHTIAVVDAHIKAVEDEMVEAELKINASMQEMRASMQNLTARVDHELLNRSRDVVTISSIYVPTTCTGSACAVSKIPQCSAHNVGHMIYLHIGTQFHTTLLCNDISEVWQRNIWAMAYSPNLNIPAGETVSLQAASLLLWADAQIQVQANASLSLSGMQFTQQINVLSGAILRVSNVLFDSMSGPALSINGFAEVLNSTFQKCDGGAIHVGKGTLCTKTPKSPQEYLCPNSATLTVRASKFIVNTASKGGAIYLDLPQQAQDPPPPPPPAVGISHFPDSTPGIPAKLLITDGTVFQGNHGGCKPSSSGTSDPNPNCDAIWWSKPKLPSSSTVPKQGYSNAEAVADQPIGNPPPYG
jgi:hypothetical protein